MRAALLLALLAWGHGSAGGPRRAGPDGGPPTFPVAGGRLRIEVCADDIVRVAFAKDDTFFTRPSLMAAAKRCTSPAWKLTRTETAATVATAKLRVNVDLPTGAVAFADAAGRPILAERAGGRSLTPATVMGEATHHVRQQWQANEGEHLYGLGQHQQGLLDIKGTDLELRQYNGEIFIPLLVSSRGYGVLWDNTSLTRFGRPEPTAWEEIPGAASGAADWTKTITATAPGFYNLHTYSAGGIQVDVEEAELGSLGGHLIDHWRQGWLPGEDVARFYVPSAGKSTKLRFRWKADIGVKIARVAIKPVERASATSLWSEVGDGVDYWFIYGPALDRVVAGYRQITGTAPMMPRWAFGLWQCRERYKTAAESVGVLDEYRKRGIPVDVIVQDWQYWRPTEWGSHIFDPARFPDPARWVADLHDRHARVMISVWPKFYRGTANFKALDAAGALYKLNLVEGKQDWLKNVFTTYDAFSPSARALYWSQIRDALFTKGIDAWWMDVSELEAVEGPFPTPAAQVEAYQTHMNPTALGSGARVLNAYPLVHAQGVHEGLRAAAPDKRVLILTRSGFAGMQRYGAASWSGDISSTWTAMRKQLAAGLGFAISGMPYWTFDTGGFSVPDRFAHAPRGSAALDEWRELNTRWFEFATFVPILRVHGQAPKREMWEFGGDDSPAYNAMLKFSRLRYRMLPYVYSLAAAVTREGGTIMRPLEMDFGLGDYPHLDDQYMFGPALLISPVTAYKLRERDVFLPPTEGGWYDFWTGGHHPSPGRHAPAPLDQIPVHVRAGSIIPFGPELQYTDEKPADPITLFVYAGRDAAFKLYEDDGVSNGYERGAFATIPLRWDDASRTLTIGKRQGTFPGMLGRRTFQVVLVSAGRAVPFSFTPKADKTIAYSGEATTVRF
ncbi:MAG TPA: TIM-barrel domain-containing protein [Polyangia bacterium]|jgi:alpha-D-xyloside xylohydrolase|nr:TIM-barrel domain-containing protein [Polyangia bacterium]